MFSFLFSNKKKKCPHCDLLLVTEEQRARHIIEQHDRPHFQSARLSIKLDSLKCLHCELKFQTASARRIHIEYNHFECGICKLTFPTLDRKEEHRLKYHSFSCINCNLVFPTNKERIIHDHAFHHFKCTKCELVWRTENERTKHMRNDHLKICQYCQFTFSETDLDKHVQLVHTFKCVTCEQVFNTNETMRKHEEHEHTHTGTSTKLKSMEQADKLICNTCGRSFKSAKIKKNHMWYVHAIHCDICYVRVVANEALETHVLKKHTHKCTDCEFSFYTRDQLRKHINDDLHFKCELCQEKCATLEERQLHFEAEHRGVMCGLCYDVFDTETQKKNHMISNHKCDVCNTSWPTLQERNNHFDQKHHFECRKCPQVFKSKPDRQKHRCVQKRLPLHERNATEKVYGPTELHSKKDLTQEKLDEHILKQHVLCNICNQIFGSRDLKEQHDLQEHNFTCDFCNKVYPTEAAHHEHAQQCFHQIRNVEFNVGHQPEQIVDRCSTFKCEMCNSSWETYGDRQRHYQLSHTINKTVFKEALLNNQHLVKCSECLGCWPTQETRDKHLKDFHSKTDGFECDVCKGTWVTVRQRDDHAARCHSIACHICFVQFNTMEELDSHYTATHLFKCYKCDGAWTTEKLRDQHDEDAHSVYASNRHDVAQQFPCSLCGESSRSSHDRDRHVNLMHSWNCTVCSKSFKTEPDKDQHVTLVHLHTCEVCDRTFNTDVLLKRHFEMVHQWDCEHCDKVCTAEVSLQLHYISMHEDLMHIESTERHHTCSVCDETFSCEDSLVNHYRAEHVEKGPRVYFDVTANGTHIGRIVMELRPDVVPMTAENFRQLCTGECGFSYKNSTFHNFIRNCICQGGDITHHNGFGGRSIYGRYFADENFNLQHDKAGVLSMANGGPNTNSSQFYITMAKIVRMDDKHVVFGRVVEGMDVVRRIEGYGTNILEPLKKIVIENCGQLKNNY